MKNNLNVSYDEKGDFFELRIGKPTVSYFEDLGKDVFKRVDEKTGEIKDFAIFNFRKIFSKQNNVDFIIPVKLELVD